MSSGRYCQCSVFQHFTFKISKKSTKLKMSKSITAEIFTISVYFLWTKTALFCSTNGSKSGETESIPGRSEMVSLGLLGVTAQVVSWGILKFHLSGLKMIIYLTEIIYPSVFVSLWQRCTVPGRTKQAQISHWQIVSKWRQLQFFRMWTTVFIHLFYYFLKNF